MNATLRLEIANASVMWPDGIAVIVKLAFSTSNQLQDVRGKRIPSAIQGASVRINMTTELTNWICYWQIVFLSSLGASVIQLAHRPMRAIQSQGSVCVV